MDGTGEFLDGSLCYFVTHQATKAQNMFLQEGDYKYYFHLLKKYKEKFKISLFAFCLMPGKVYLILQPRSQEDLFLFMQRVSRVFNLYFNARYHRKGRLWEARCTNIVIDDDDFFSLVKFLEFIPVQAQLTDTPLLYPWSSCRYRVLCPENSILDKHTFLEDVFQKRYVSA